MVRIEEENDQGCIFLHGRGETKACLFDSEVVILAIGPGLRSSQSAVGNKRLVGVRVKVVDIVHTSPFDVLFEPDSRGPVEG
jgi:hypothetical protein